MTIGNTNHKLNKTGTILLVFVFLCCGYIIQAQSNQYTILFHCPMNIQSADSLNTFLFNLENNIEQSNESSYDTICVFAKEQVMHWNIVLKQIVSKANFDEFSDQLPGLLAGKDSMFYIEKTEMVSVRRGLFKKSYPKKVRLSFSPERVLKENFIIMEYLQQYYQCKHFRMVIETELKHDTDCWSKEEMGILQQVIVDSLNVEN